MFADSQNKKAVVQCIEIWKEKKKQFEMLKKKWGSKIVKLDTSNKGRSKKNRKYIDYNPIIKIPIKGI